MDTGNRLERLRKRAGTIIPLLSNSLDRAVQVAEAMEARAFGAVAKRTFYREIRLSCTDRLALAGVFLPLAAGIAMRVFGYGAYAYYPSLQALDLRGLALLLPASMALLLLAVLPLALLQRRLAFD